MDESISLLEGVADDVNEERIVWNEHWGCSESNLEGHKERIQQEGITTMLRDHTSKDTGIILKDEFTRLLKDSKSKLYCSDMTEFLSNMYDGMIQKRFTRKAKLEHVQFCYASLIGTTTPYFYTILDLDFFLQGLGNRFLYDLFPKNFEVREFNGTDFFFDFKNTVKRDKQIEGFAKPLAKMITDGLPDCVIPEDEASELLVDFRNACTIDSKNQYDNSHLDPIASYLHRLPAKAFKLAGLHAVSRVYKRDHSDRFVPIEEYDAKWAISRARHFLRNFKLLMEEWKIFKSVRAKPVETETNYYEMFHTILRQNGGSLIHEQFCRKVDLPRDKVRQIMGELMRRDTVQITEGSSGKKGGPKPKVYTLVGYQSKR